MSDSLPSKRVLVLNRLWQPVNIVGVRRAFSLLMQEHAQALDTSNGGFQMMDAAQWIEFSLENPPETEYDTIHTIRMRMRIPSVMLLREYDRVPSKEVKFNRHNVFDRDDHTCQYCGHNYHERDLNLDHVIPRDQGGRTTWENIVTSCIRCNTQKANKMPHQAGMRLLKKPARPKWRPFVSLVDEQEPEPEWMHFIAK
ncbi:HNH endonuclease [Cerasicoccus arenae]|uniref:HNH endonuclease n=1 Tax=Cerasicoccus arenae TaxID=424488 RepID=UPI0016763849|nr:HNH endonuclease [Cerasicoccus arenae]MBK1856897.1 HNH endonuclease [Cerasicoccus arenae]